MLIFRKRTLSFVTGVLVCLKENMLAFEEENGKKGQTTSMSHRIFSKITVYAWQFKNVKTTTQRII